MSKVLLISNDVVGPTMAGPGIRYTEMAKTLQKDHQVMLAAPEPSVKIDDIQTIVYQHGKFKSLIPYLEKANVVIAQSLHPTLLRMVRKNDIRYVADFYDPIVLENLEAQRTLDIEEQSAQNKFFLSIMSAQLATADHFLCASERQRDYWLGTLTALGRLTPDIYREDPSLESLISIVPFGYKNEVPKVINDEALAAFVPHFNPKKDNVIIWGGGVWNWFDPLTLIQALEGIAKKRNDIKLLFLGTKHPNPNTPEMKMITEAHKLATELKLKNNIVFFNEGWVPYEELADYLAPAAIGASLHFDHAETRMSFRTRILSYIWAGLPILTTRGDSMSDLVEKEGLGITVDYKDVAAVEKAIIKLIDDKDFRKDVRQNLARLWPAFTWNKLLRPLANRIKADSFVDQILSAKDFNKVLSNYYISGARKVWQNKGLSGIISKLSK